MSNQSFKIGSQVSLKSDPAQTGYVIAEPRKYSNGYEYHIVINGIATWYAEDDLLSFQTDITQWLRQDDFLIAVLLNKLSHPLADNLYSYRASRTEYAAYQFKPALKFLNNPEQRILIADEVGLGKTIEACIIYLELKARLDISQVMIVCPSRLKNKWRDELSNRFEEDFRDYDSKGMVRLLDDYRRTNGTVPFRVITSLETLRSEDMRHRLMEAQLRLDLLIVDEAHHMRNSDTGTHQVGALLADLADAVIFLTATPLHLGNQDLYNLLHILSPGEFNDIHLFSDVVEPNSYINRAVQLLAAGYGREALDTLRRVEATALRRRFLGNPFYKSVVDRLEADSLDRAERINIQRELMDLNTLATIVTRTRKREVSDAAERTPFSIRVEFTREESIFYDAVLDAVREELREQNYGAISFAIIMKERMAASCLVAVRESYEEIEKKQRAFIGAEKSIYDIAASDNDSDDSFTTYHTRHLLHLSKQIGAIDSKFDRFMEVIEDVLKNTPKSKILVFSSFRRTLKYLYNRLSANYRVGLIHGDVKMAHRQEIIDKFRLDENMQILLSSEVGAEGLDFQFCDVLINYDLPWNPMQVEQRIGRLDRFGQTHKRIRIYNFFIENTIETRILERLYTRINIFKEAIGDLEAILGAEIRTLSKEVLQAELTPAQEEKRAEDAANRILQLQLDQEKLDAKRDELLGQDAILNQQIESRISSGRVIHTEEVRAVVERYLKENYPQVEFTRDSEEATWTLTFHPRLSSDLHKHIQTNSKRNLAISERFQEAMTHGKQIALTFDSDYARRPLLEFITFNHVLADVAIQYWKTKYSGKVFGLRGIQVEGAVNEIGFGYFFIYALDEDGVQRRRTLHPIIVLDSGQLATKTATILLGSLQDGQAFVQMERDESEFLEAESKANEWIASQRDTQREDSLKRSESILQARMAAIEQSYNAKIRRVEQIRQKVANENIRRLHDGTIRNLTAQKQGKLEDLAHRPKVSVSYSMVAVGRIEVVPSDRLFDDDTKFEEIKEQELEVKTLSHDDEILNKKHKLSFSLENLKSILNRARNKKG